MKKSKKISYLLTAFLVASLTQLLLVQAVAAEYKYIRLERIPICSQIATKNSSRREIYDELHDRSIEIHTYRGRATSLIEPYKYYQEKCSDNRGTAPAQLSSPLTLNNGDIIYLPDIMPLSFQCGDNTARQFTHSTDSDIYVSELLQRCNRRDGSN